MKSKSRKGKAVKATQAETTVVESDPNQSNSYSGNQEWIAEEMAAGGKFSWIS